MIKDDDPEHRRRDLTEDDVEEADEPQAGLQDIESLSSGSSIELLNLSDEGQQTPADEQDQASVELSKDRDKEEDQRELSDEADGEEFTGASHSVMSSSDHRSDSSAGSESWTNEGGEVENVLTADELEADNSTVAVYMMPSEMTERSVDDGNDKDDEMHPVAEADRSDEHSQRDLDVQQSTVTSASTNSTAASTSFDSTLNEAIRFSIINCIMHINTNRK